MLGREIEEQVEHDHIVRLLHKEYYHYPSPSHPHLMSFANHPTKSKAVFDQDGNELFPDIVVLHTTSERLMMIAEVETESSVVEDEAHEWRDFARLGVKFYLYFPKGYGARVTELAQGIEITELVQYAREDSRLILERYQ